jgi:hypothetical protein
MTKSQHFIAGSKSSGFSIGPMILVPCCSCGVRSKPVRLFGILSWKGNESQVKRSVVQISSGVCCRSVVACAP